MRRTTFGRFSRCIGTEAREDQGVDHRAEPEDLGIVAEPARSDDQGLAQTDHDARENASAKAQARAGEEPLRLHHGLADTGSIARGIRFDVFESERDGLASRGFVIDLFAVHPTVGRRVFLATSQPEEDSEEGRDLTHPEPERRRNTGNDRTDQGPDGQDLGRLADAHAADGRADHRREDLDRGTEDDRPEETFPLSPDGQGHEVIHHGRREMEQEAQKEKHQDQGFLVPVCRRRLRESEDHTLDSILGRDGRRFDHPLDEAGEP